MDEVYIISPKKFCMSKIIQSILDLLITVWPIEVCKKMWSLLPTLSYGIAKRENVVRRLLPKYLNWWKQNYFSFIDFKSLETFNFILLFTKFAKNIKSVLAPEIKIWDIKRRKISVPVFLGHLACNVEKMTTWRNFQNNFFRVNDCKKICEYLILMSIVVYEHCQLILNYDLIYVYYFRLERLGIWPECMDTLFQDAIKVSINLSGQQLKEKCSKSKKLKKA